MTDSSELPDATGDQVGEAVRHIRNALRTVQYFGTDLNAGQVYSIENQLGAALTVLGQSPNAESSADDSGAIREVSDA